jgi:putative flippase GtrA
MSDPIREDGWLEELAKEAGNQADGPAGEAAGKAADQTGGKSGIPWEGLVQFIKFGLVGVMNTAVDFIVYTLLMVAGVHYLAAQVVSYAAGTVNSYVVNKLWTFNKGKEGGQTGKAAPLTANRAEFVRFAVLNAGTLLLSLALLYLLKSGLELPALLAKLLVTVVTVMVNYIGSKLWVFRKM